jgi:HlyD family secretion protein
MSHPSAHPHRKPGPAIGLLLFAGVLMLVSCDREQPATLQGYVEGEFLHIASPLAGPLQTLSVSRGQQVKAGDPLFALDATPERAAVEAAERRLAQARATLEDLRKGQRPSEIAALEAQLAQAQAASRFSQSEFQRLEELMPTRGASVNEYQRARANRDQDIARIAQIEAQLETARLGARTDQVAAAEAEVQARAADLESARWKLSQKSLSAPADALVFDTLFRPGEEVAANRPIVQLLPPGNVKVRAFVAEPQVGSIQLNDPVTLRADGLTQPIPGRVTYISPRAEYTPPVIYSREARAKLVYMIEIHPSDPAHAPKLHPGQPVDVQLDNRE